MVHIQSNLRRKIANVTKNIQEVKQFYLRFYLNTSFYKIVYQYY